MSLFEIVPLKKYSIEILQSPFLLTNILEKWNLR